jgi:hypothetical protein
MFPKPWRKWLDPLRRSFRRGGRARRLRRDLGVEPLEDRTLLNAANTAYVGGLYELILRRPADVPGLQFWGGLLDQGQSPVQIVWGIEHSFEYRTLRVNDLYTSLLHHPADAYAFQFWRGLMASGLTEEEVQADILGSLEYFQARGGGTTDGFLTALYHDVLGRGVDPLGRALFGGQLASGASPGAVAMTVVSSMEARQDEVDGLYRRFLNHSADAVGLQFWTGQFLVGPGGASYLPAGAGLARFGLGEVVAGIAGSWEAYGHVTAAASGPPTVWITSPVSDLATDGNVVVTGRVTDPAFGVRSLQARVDGGRPADVAFDGSGNFRCTTSLPLDGSAAGDHTVLLQAVDVAGHPSIPAVVSFALRAHLTAVTFTLQGHPFGPQPSPGSQPLTVVIQSPAAGLLTSQNVTVMGQVGGGAGGVALLQGQVDSGPLFNVSFDPSTGSFSFPTNLPLDGSADGSHTVRLQATDRAGNVSAGAALTFTLSAVTLTKLPKPVLDPASDSGASNSDGITNVTTPVVHVAAHSGLTVALLVNGQVAQRAVSADGTATFTLGPLGEGTYSITASRAGLDGSLSATSDPLSVRIITTPPAVPAFDLSAASTDGAPGSHTTSAARVTLVGQTSPALPVTLVGTGLTVLASGTGVFQIPDVTLALGANPLTVQVVDIAGNTSRYALTVTRTNPAGRPNAVLAWNQAALSAIQKDASDPLVASRGLAMVQAAVYDAVNAIEGTPAYYVKVPAPAGASAAAAVSAAAHRVLGYLYPAQQSDFDALLATELALVPDGRAKTDGLTVGQTAGDAMIALRANDGYNAFVDFTSGTGAGVWQPTPPAYAEALDPQWANLKPFAMTSPGQFLPAGPPALSSQAWAAAVNEVKSLGSATSTTRTADQTQIAHFWADGAGTVSPPGQWNAIAGQIAQQQGDSLADDARLFAVLDVTMADAGTVAWNTKFHYDTWRPITAIRSADTAGNPAVTADPNWTPLLTTPNFPE